MKPANFLVADACVFLLFACAGGLNAPSRNEYSRSKELRGMVGDSYFAVASKRARRNISKATQIEPGHLNHIALNRKPSTVVVDVVVPAREASSQLQVNNRESDERVHHNMEREQMQADFQYSSGAEGMRVPLPLIAVSVVFNVLGAIALFFMVSAMPAVQKRLSATEPPPLQPQSASSSSSKEAPLRGGILSEENETEFVEATNYDSDVLWEKYQHEPPNLFKFLNFANDNGFHDVKYLYAHSRVPMTFMLVAMVLFNVLNVIWLDLDIIRNPVVAINGLKGNPAKVLHSFYFSNYVCQWVGKTFFGYYHPISPVHFLGALELLGLVYHLLIVLKYSVDIIRFQGFKRWYGISAIAWDILYSLSTYSAIKLLHNFLPLNLNMEIRTFVHRFGMAYEGQTHISWVILDLFMWLLLLTVSFFVGFDAFLMRLRIVADCAEIEGFHWEIAHEIFFNSMLPCVQFLLQVIGVVQLDALLRKRLFLFAFGGEEGLFTDCDHALKELWYALASNMLYRVYPFWKFIIVLTTFSNTDFQQLVLQQRKDLKSEATREFMVATHRDYDIIERLEYIGTG